MYPDGATWAFVRDVSLGLDYAGVYLYSGQGFVVRKDSGVRRVADLDGATAHVIDARADIGSRLRAPDEAASLGEDFSVQLSATPSSIRDLDYAEALSRPSQQMFGLQAAQQSYARIQGLSLFNYL